MDLSNIFCEVTALRLVNTNTFLRVGKIKFTEKCLIYLNFGLNNVTEATKMEK